MRNVTEVLAGMVELARSRGHDKDAQTVQDLFHDFQMQAMTRNAIPPPEPTAQFPDSGDPDWVPSLKWKIKHPGAPRPPYILDSGFHTISDATYENMPDPTEELSSDQLGLLRQGFLTFYDLSLAILKEISNTKLGFRQKKPTKYAMVSEVSYTLQILISNDLWLEASKILRGE